jgi:hypothetical protein
MFRPTNARGDLFQKRRALMDDWSNYAMGGGGKVLSISLGKKRAGIREGRSLPDNTGKEAIS